MAEKKKPNKSSAADVDEKQLSIVLRSFIKTKEWKQNTSFFVNPILEAEVERFFFLFQSIVWIFKPATNRVPDVSSLVWSVRGDLVRWWMDILNSRILRRIYGSNLNLCLYLKPTLKYSKSQKQSTWEVTSGRSGTMRGQVLGQTDGWVWWMLSTCATQKY